MADAMTDSGTIVAHLVDLLARERAAQQEYEDACDLYGVDGASSVDLLDTGRLQGCYDALKLIFGQVEADRLWGEAQTRFAMEGRAGARLAV